MSVADFVFVDHAAKLSGGTYKNDRNSVPIIAEGVSKLAGNTGKGKSAYSHTHFDAPEIKAAPHPHVSPSRAIGAPSHWYFLDPDMIAVTPWPGIGQECRSPFRAINAPSHCHFEADEITVPP
jgi:hypothetical protein